MWKNSWFFEKKFAKKEEKIMEREKYTKYKGGGGWCESGNGSEIKSKTRTGKGNGKMWNMKSVAVVLLIYVSVFAAEFSNAFQSCPSICTCKWKNGKTKVIFYFCSKKS